MDEGGRASGLNRRTNVVKASVRARISPQAHIDGQQHNVQPTMPEPRPAASSTRRLSDLHVPRRPILDSHYHNHEHPSQRQRLQLPPLSSLGRHMQRGDGLDHRRPVVSSNERASTSDPFLQDTEPIDLTRVPTNPERQAASRAGVAVVDAALAQRLPRYDRDIIDISDSDDETDRRARGREAENAHQRQESPLFVEDDGMLDIRARARVLDASLPASRGQSQLIDLTTEPDDDLIITDARSLNSINRPEPVLSRGTGVMDIIEPPVPGDSSWQGMLRNTQRLASRVGAIYGDFERLRNGQSSAAQRAQPRPQHEDRYSGVGANAANVSRNLAEHFGRHAALGISGIIPIINLDYGLVGSGFGARPSPESHRYKSPPAPSSGFTRSPGEDEEVVCPNCGSELAIGDCDIQRQVWVVKACGHAYCGNCVNTRLMARAIRGPDKGKQRAVAGRLLRKCVIERCGKPVSKSTVVHVFLTT